MTSYNSFEIWDLVRCCPSLNHWQTDNFESQSFSASERWDLSKTSFLTFGSGTMRGKEMERKCWLEIFYSLRGLKGCERRCKEAKGFPVLNISIIKYWCIICMFLYIFALSNNDTRCCFVEAGCPWKFCLWCRLMSYPLTPQQTWDSCIYTPFVFMYFSCMSEFRYLCIDVIV